MVIWLCLLANKFILISFSLYSYSFFIFSTISSSIGTIYLFKSNPLVINFFWSNWLNHGCFLICVILYLFFGSTFNILTKKSFAFSLKNSGILKIPFFIFSYNLLLSLSSKGNLPHNIVYKITPQDQISAPGPQYFSPESISGAA